MDARVDETENYRKACRQCHNLYVQKHGGVTRRPGSQLIASTKFYDVAGSTEFHAAVLYKFQYSPAVGFMLEFGDKYVRFYTSGSQVTVSSATPWTSSQFYPPGSYVSYSGTIYYNPYGSDNALTPPTASSGWYTGQWIWTTPTSGTVVLEQPTPYGALYYPLGAPPAWSTSGYTGQGYQTGAYYLGMYVASGGSNYVCTKTNIPGATFAADLAAGYWGLASSVPTTPFQTDIFDVVPCQVNDVVYLAHPKYAVQQLTRFSNTDWMTTNPSEHTLTNGVFVPAGLQFDTPPFLDQNATDTTLTPSATAGQGITLTASAPAWAASNYYNIGNSVLVTSAMATFVAGSTYVISTLGAGVNWVAMGCPTSPALGVTFVYNGTTPAGSGGFAYALYECQQAHVSNVFASDYLLGYWSQQAIFYPTVGAGNYLGVGACPQVGSTWQLSYLNNSSYIEVDGTAAGGFTNLSTPYTSQTIQTLGPWQLHSYGTWAADVAVQQSLDGGQTWNTALTLQSRFDRNVDDTGTAVVLSLYRLVITNTSSPSAAGATNPRLVFQNQNSLVYGTVLLTSVQSPYTATGNVLTQLSTYAPWVSSQPYTTSPLSTVSYAGLVYNCILAFSGSVTPPPSDPTHWSILTGVTNPSLATEYWSEGAWSYYRGFPTACCTYQQRLVYGGSGYEPQRIWGSQSNDLDNFALGDQTLATDSYAFDLAAVGRGGIQWLSAQTDLIVGFSGAEWVVNSGQGTGGSQTITPSQINAVEHSTWGSVAAVQPLVVADATFYTQRQAKTVRQMLFSVYTSKYMSQDLAYYSDHLFSSGIQQMDYQAQFQNQGILWVTTGAGTLCGMTYELENNVEGWHRHTTGDVFPLTVQASTIQPGFTYTILVADGTDWTSIGSPNNSVGTTFMATAAGTGSGTATYVDEGFEFVGVIDGHGVNDDEVWVIANRTLANGTMQRFVERLNPTNWQQSGTNGTVNTPYAFYVDCGTQVVSPVSNTIAVNSLLNGRRVNVCLNGVMWIQNLSVSNGSVIIPNYTPQVGDVVTVGLPIQYHLQPMRLDYDARVGGNTQGIEKGISDLRIRLYNSLSGNVTDGGTNTRAIDYGAQDQTVFTANTLFTGEKRVLPFSTYSVDPPYVLTSTDPLPLTCLALIVEYDIIGKG
jgi:hypothetical protein